MHGLRRPRCRRGPSSVPNARIRWPRRVAAPRTSPIECSRRPPRSRASASSSPCCSRTCKGSTELIADRDPEEARKLLDPVLEHMCEAVEKYGGTVSQVLGDGILAFFGAPIVLGGPRGPGLLRRAQHAGPRAPLRRRHPARVRRAGPDPRRAPFRRGRAERQADTACTRATGRSARPCTSRREWNRWPSPGRCSPRPRPSGSPRATSRRARSAPSA